MKRTGLIVALALLMPVLFTSCKKDFVCTCQSTDALGNTSTETYPLTDQTRADADDACEAFESDNFWATRNCHL